VLDDARLLGWDELCMFFSSDNEYILTGHRKASSSYLGSLKSILRVHNETVNIWSHVLGALAFLTAAGTLYSMPYPSRPCTQKADVLAIFIYFASVIACFVFSFIYHIFLDHSEQTRKITCRFDYLGIIVPLWGTTVASTHFGLVCEPALQYRYQALATIAGGLSAIATLHPLLSGPNGKPVRTAMYCLLGISSFLPVVHGVMLHGFEEHNRRMSLQPFLGLATCHSTGAMLYAARIPERWFPRRFDIVGSSHQLMHVLVVVGAVCYCIGVLEAFEHW
ncbi:Hly-III related protein, partial [Setomelanomma holmii]